MSNIADRILSISPGGLMTDNAVAITTENAIAKHLVWIGLEGKSPNTITGRHGTLNRVSEHIGPVPLADATPDDLLKWRLALRNRADNYILAQVSHVRCFYAWLIETGYRADNPGRRLPVPRKPSGIPHPISEDDLRTAIDHAPERIRLWLILAAWCGLRACEIALLRRKCIRENGPHPHLIILADATKGRYEATIPLCAYAVGEIRAAGLPLTGWAFARLDGQPGPVSPHRVSALCNQYLHGLGFPDTLHTLRARFGTEVLRSTGNVRTAQKALRHRRLDTTAVYTMVTNEEVEAAVATIPAPRRLRSAPGTRGAAAAVIAAMITAAAVPAVSPAAPRSHVARRPAISRAALDSAGDSDEKAA